MGIYVGRDWFNVGVCIIVDNVDWCGWCDSKFVIEFGLKFLVLCVRVWVMFLCKF